MNQQPLDSLKGIGEKTGRLFAKLGIETVDELLEYYPRAYDACEEPVSVGELKPDTVMAVSGVLFKSAEVKRYSHIQVITTMIRDITGSLTLTWYNMPYLHATLKAGMRAVFRGRVVKKNGRLTMEQPEIYLGDAYGEVIHSMQPIYGQTKGLPNKTIVRAVKQALSARQMVRDYMPLDLRIRHELAEYNFAIEHIHFPTDRTELLFARKRLVFDEFFLFLMAVRRLKDRRVDRESHFPMNPSDEVMRLVKNLPYALTNAQNKVLTEVFRDMTGKKVMNRLIQGDVGSGKTIIAVLALLETACNGFQGALMVPTEVLARQHYESMLSLFEENGIEKQVVLVTGSMTAKEKRTAYEKIASHEADIIVGTHALIQEKVVYDKLALVITDEQHRFGVSQREMLGDKGDEPHILVMSATPIPRSALPGISVEYLHGKMKAREKNAIMERFAAGEIKVLVSTTVVEVGVNVPNATVMMIENAERFGLAQLHQLRGRVGRGKHQSYCILVDGSGQEGTRERLTILSKSNDGFYIASEDLKLRGPGDIFGLRQSGDLEFKLADIFTDANILKTVSEEVNRLLDEDPELTSEEHIELGKKLSLYLEKSYDKLNL